MAHLRSRIRTWTFRGIPGWWRLLDASFGMAGFVPAWLCHRWSRRLEAEMRQ